MGRYRYVSYSTILIADDVTTGGAGASLVPILINYASSGGYVVIVDKGAENHHTI